MGGQFAWDPRNIRLHLTECQKDGKRIKGHEVRCELKDQPIMNANLLDFLHTTPRLIPKEWEEGRGQCVFFWGTIYRDGDRNLYVRYLYRSDGHWHWSDRGLDGDWYSDYLTAVSASLP